jgi:hypothetical protein
MGRREGRAAGEVLRCCAQGGLRIEGGANPVGKERWPPLQNRDPRDVGAGHGLEQFAGHVARGSGQPSSAMSAWIGKDIFAHGPV